MSASHPSHEKTCSSRRTPEGDDNESHAIDGTSPKEMITAVSASDEAVEMSMPHQESNTLVILGATGDLATKSIYPALWMLFKRNELPENLSIVGYGRSPKNISDFKKKNLELVHISNGDEYDKFDQFWSKNLYVQGSYDDEGSAIGLQNKLREIESGFIRGNRTFYLSLPPSVYTSVANLIRGQWMAPKGRTRVALEKPFGRDLASSEELDQHLSKLFLEEQIRRIDHYLCLEMVKAVMAIRFANAITYDLWNSEHIASVLITFKEDFGTYGRSGYFDTAGIIRDVMQNHLLQILCLTAMEPPASDTDEEVKKAKIEVLKAIQPILAEDIVLGQYVQDARAETGSAASFGYLDDPKVPKDSKTATFATIVFRIDNERWSNVPFIMRVGKALDEVKDEIRLQFKEIPQERKDLFGEEVVDRNEIIIRLKPYEEIAAMISTKHPGMSKELECVELDLNYKSKFSGVHLAGAYERLLKTLIHDSSASHFVSREELKLSWELFTPILEEIESGHSDIPVYPYAFGSKGPEQADRICEENNFKLTGKNPW